MEIFDQSLTILEKSLDVRTAQQRVIAANLANIDTPGFVARKLDFEASLQNALAEEPAPPVIAPSTDPPLSLDGNNVNLEQELGAMGQNRIMYSVTAQILAAKLRQLSSVVESGQ
jgi:flagellar basal-body rod protein FlgB